jgi:hypothetical protein
VTLHAVRRWRVIDMKRRRVAQDRRYVFAFHRRPFVSAFDATRMTAS